jgi:peptidoglycan/xylan/chitin deacetylase (PgdA/CDA1 family)
MRTGNSRGRRAGAATPPVPWRRGLAATLALAAAVTVTACTGGSGPSSASKVLSAAPAVTDPVPSGLGGTNWDSVKTSNKIVALTFDGGSGAEAVDSILDVLKAQAVPATFFLTGEFVTKFPDKARAIVAAGERVGDHTVTHPHFITDHLTDAQMRAQVRNARQQIISATGADPWPWFRFPYGELNAHTISVVNSTGFVPIGWTVDTLGWKGAKDTGVTVTTIVNRVVASLKPGEIVLMHVGAAPDGTTLDADALPSIISELRARGYSFVTMDAMLGYRILISNGGVRAFGSAYFGSAAGKLGTGVTATAVAPSRKTGGYLMLKSDGGVLEFNATWYGSLKGHLPAGVRPRAIATGRSNGYLILTSDGGVSAFGRAFYGSDAGQLASGVTARGLAIDSSTGGYWILRSDGQVDAFNAPALGGLTSLPSGVRPAGIAAGPGESYYVLTSDGDVHGFGTTARGSLLGKLPAGRTAVGITADNATGGYWILTSNGGVSSFRAPWWGSMAGKLAAHQSATGIAGQ